MKQLKKYIGGTGDVLGIIGKTLGSYLGVVSNIAGTIIGIFATVLVIASIVGLCLYVKFLPMFTEARETVFDKLVNMSEDDFVMKEDTVVYDKDGKLVGSVNAGRYKYAGIKSISHICIMVISLWKISVLRHTAVWICLQRCVPALR